MDVHETKNPYGYYALITEKSEMIRLAAFLSKVLAGGAYCEQSEIETAKEVRDTIHKKICWRVENVQ